MPRKPKISPARRGKTGGKPDDQSGPSKSGRKPLAPRAGHLGNPPFVATQTERNLVMMGKVCGYTDVQIARLIRPEDGGISVDTLARHFRQELDRGVETMNTAVVNSLFAKAVGTSPQAVTACIFWLKARAGWKDRDALSAHLKVNGGGDDDGGEGGSGAPLGAGGTIEFTLNLGEPKDDLS